MITVLEVGYRNDKELQAGEGHDWLAHRPGVLTLVVRGCLRERFESGLQTCSPLELHWKPPGSVHTTETGPDGVRMLMLAIRPELVAAGALSRYTRPQQVEVGAESVRALRILRDPSSAKRVVSEADIVNVVFELLSAMNQAVGVGIRGPAWLQAAREWARQRAPDCPTVEGIAERVGVHPGSLSRAFRRTYGTPLADFLRKERLRRAVASIGRRNRSLADVALDAGFCDQSHLNRVFARETGWTPGQFRRSLFALAG